jgi:hypothetical protein
MIEERKRKKKKERKKMQLNLARLTAQAAGSQAQLPA